MSELREVADRIWVGRSSGSSEHNPWDDEAEYYGGIAIPTPETDDFLKLVCEVCELTGDESVIDIGCGSGQYAAALAPMVRYSLGIDSSEGMIRESRKRVGNNSNLSFELMDWHSVKTTDEPLSGGFDVTIAHTTPAISSADDFRKMIGVTRRWGFITFCTRRIDHLVDGLWKTFGKEGMGAWKDLEAPCAFDILWESGLDPEIHYEKDIVWDDPVPLKKALRLCRSSMERNGLKDNGEAEEYVRSIAMGDGMVPSRITCDLTTIYWSVE